MATKTLIVFFVLALAMSNAYILGSVNWYENDCSASSGSGYCYAFCPSNTVATGGSCDTDGYSLIISGSRILSTSYLCYYNTGGYSSSATIVSRVACATIISTDNSTAVPDNFKSEFLSEKIKKLN